MVMMMMISMMTTMMMMMMMMMIIIIIIIIISPALDVWELDSQQKTTSKGNGPKKPYTADIHIITANNI